MGEWRPREKVTNDTEATGVKNLGSGDRLTLVPVLAPPFSSQVSLTLSFFKGEIGSLNIPTPLGCDGCEMDMEVIKESSWYVVRAHVSY